MKDKNYKVTVYFRSGNYVYFHEEKEIVDFITQAWESYNKSLFKKQSHISIEYDNGSRCLNLSQIGMIDIRTTEEGENE